MPYLHLLPAALLVLFLGTCAPPPSATYAEPPPDAALNLPYAAAGWTDREAADYLADRFTFGRTDALIQQIEADPAAWMQSQLYPDREPALDGELRGRYPYLRMEGDNMVRKYPAPVLRLIYTIVRANINKVDYSDAVSGDASVLNEKLDLLVDDALNVRREDRELFTGQPDLQAILDRQDYGDFMALLHDMRAVKTERALRSDNQLAEVLTDFWFNHFNVSLTRINESANWIPSYERDAIRPFIFGRFGEMLAATAQHPAMITYLDNGRNNPAEGAPTLLPQTDQREKLGEENYELLKDFLDRPGINENYARELLELHTLGVNGGYGQRDVQELARILTGWKIPLTTQPLPGIIRAFVSLGMKGQKGSVVTPTFYFNPEWHDAGSKTLLGKNYPAGGGHEEGLRALAQLAAHPSTARFIATKFVRRFTTADPPAGLVQALADDFRRSGGDLRSLMKTLVQHPEFWQKSHQNQKLKPPFHYLVSAVRSSGATVGQPTELIRWATKLGQPLYACQPPTGYPDTRAFWSTGGGMLGRMDFAAELTAGRVTELRAVSGGDQLLLELAGPAFQNY